MLERVHDTAEMSKHAVINGSGVVVTSRFFRPYESFSGIRFTTPNNPQNACAKRAIPYEAIKRQCVRYTENPDDTDISRLLCSKLSEIIDEQRTMESLLLPEIYLPDDEIETILRDRTIGQLPAAAEGPLVYLRSSTLILVGLAFAGKTTMVRDFDIPIVEFDSFSPDKRLDALKQSEQVKRQFLPSTDPEIESYRTEARSRPYQNWIVEHSGPEAKKWISENMGDEFDRHPIHRIFLCNTVLEANNINVLDKTVLLIKPDHDEIEANFEMSDDVNKVYRKTLNDVWETENAENTVNTPLIPKVKLIDALNDWVKQPVAQLRDDPG
jgi:hypothetical protein